MGTVGGVCEGGDAEADGSVRERETLGAVASRKECMGIIPFGNNAAFSRTQFWSNQVHIYGEYPLLNKAPPPIELARKLDSCLQVKAIMVRPSRCTLLQRPKNLDIVRISRVFPLDS